MEGRNAITLLSLINHDHRPRELHIPRHSRAVLYYYAIFRDSIFFFTHKETDRKGRVSGLLFCLFFRGNKVSDA